MTYTNEVKTIPWWDVEEQFRPYEEGSTYGDWVYLYRGEVIGYEDSPYKAQREAEWWFKEHPEHLSLFAPASYVEHLKKVNREFIEEMASLREKVREAEKVAGIESDDTW